MRVLVSTSQVSISPGEAAESHTHAQLHTQRTHTQRIITLTQTRDPHVHRAQMPRVRQEGTLRENEKLHRAEWLLLPPASQHCARK